MSRFNRVFVIVIDSLGVGAMADADRFGDQGANTFSHISESVDTFAIPNLQKLGMANIIPLKQVAAKEHPIGYYGKLNEASSGTEILDELAEEEIATGNMIVYTSADSVLQICGNEETFDLEELYRCCEIARKITMRDDWKVGRVIARPYVGRKRGEFKRTSNRHDYALKPIGKTALDALWGHRRDPMGYAREIEMFDKGLGELFNVLREDDLLLITADHGNDPTYTGTDHTREKLPLLAYSRSFERGGELPEADTFAVVGATIADNFQVNMPEGTIGTSILNTFI